MIPETVGRYQILRKLGAGGMGEVYLAEDTALKRRVAIKFVIASEAGDVTSRARLVREAQSAATLDHPNVCGIYEVGEYNGQPFFVWGQRYNNRRVAEVFDVQEEIARAIGSSLRLELAGREAGFSKRYTDNIEAYRAYVLGREYAQRRTVTDLEAAVNHYKQAIRSDGRFCPAWAGLTDAYINLCARGVLPYSEGRRLVLEAAERARTLDPDLAEAHAAVGQTHVYIGPFDFESGDRALSRAIELNPGWPLAHQYQAVSLLEQGRLGEGVRQLEIADEQDPLSGFITRFLAYAYVLQGDFARAMTTHRTAASSGPPFATNWEAELFIRAGATDEGLHEIGGCLQR